MIESMVKKMLKMKDWKGLKVENALNMRGKRGFN
jgi:ribosomal protein S13